MGWGGCASFSEEFDMKIFLYRMRKTADITGITKLWIVKGDYDVKKSVDWISGL